MSVSEDTLRSLLLHRLSPDDTDELMSRVVTEDGLAEQLELAGNDLLDDYAHDRLPAQDRAALEQHLLTDSHWRERALAAKALAQVPRAAGPPVRAFSRRRWFLPAMAALAACTLAIVLLPMLNVSSIPSTQTTQMTQTISLLAQTQRGDQAATLHIDRHAARIRFQLEVPGDQPAATYHVVAESGQQKNPWMAQHLAPRQSGGYRYVEVTIPTQVFAPGSNRLTLAADRDDAQRNELDTFTWELQTTLN